MSDKSCPSVWWYDQKIEAACTEPHYWTDEGPGATKGEFMPHCKTCGGFRLSILLEQCRQDGTKPPRWVQSARQEADAIAARRTAITGRKWP